MKTAIGQICPSCREIVFSEGECGCTPAWKIRRRVYSSRRWRDRTRPAVISRENGICQECGEPGNHVDHDVSVVLLVRSGRDPFDPDRCRLLCDRCHGRKHSARAVRRF